MDTKITQPTVNEGIADFFQNQIDFKEFAQQIRRSNYILSDLMMQPEIADKVSKSYWVRDCFFFLNQFAEIIDPLLEKE